MSETTDIYVSLLDEGVDVRRPVEAEHLHDDVYRITATVYDREVEAWQFEPGDVVVCELRQSSDGPILAATALHDG